MYSPANPFSYSYRPSVLSLLILQCLWESCLIVLFAISACAYICACMDVEFLSFTSHTHTAFSLSSVLAPDCMLLIQLLPHFSYPTLSCSVAGGTGRIEATNLACDSSGVCSFSTATASCTHSQDLVLQCSKLIINCN